MTSTPLTGFSTFLENVFEATAKNFIPNKIFSCSLIIGTSVHEKTWQIGPTVLPLKLDEGGV